MAFDDRYAVNIVEQIHPVNSWLLGLRSSLAVPASDPMWQSQVETAATTTPNLLLFGLFFAREGVDHLRFWGVPLECLFLYLGVGLIGDVDDGR